MPSPRLRQRATLAFLLIPPLAWLVVAYLGSLAVLLVSAFWGRNSFTGAVVRTFTVDNLVRVLTEDVFRTTTLRTVGVAATVTVLCAVLAVPLALYMAKVASPARAHRPRRGDHHAVVGELSGQGVRVADAAVPGRSAVVGDRLLAGVRPDGDGASR